MIAKGDEITVAGDVIGSVTSADRSGAFALGYVKRGTSVPGTADVSSKSVDLRVP